MGTTKAFNLSIMSFSKLILQLRKQNILLTNVLLPAGHKIFEDLGYLLMWRHLCTLND